MFLFTFIVFLDCRCCLPRYNNDIAANFFIVATLLTVFKQCDQKKTPCDPKKTQAFSHDSKNGPPYPGTPAWRHIVVITFLSHGHKKMGKKNIHNYFIHRHIDPVYGLFNVP